MFFYVFLVISFGVYIGAFLNLFSASVVFTNQVSLLIYIVIVFWYLKRNRQGVFFCPEVLYFIFSFIISFFDLAVLNYTSQYSSFFSLFEAIDKSRYLSMLGLILFVSGLEFGNRRAKYSLYVNHKNKYRIFPGFISSTFHVCVLCLMVLFYLTGVYSIFFKYTAGSSDGASNMGWVCTSTCLMVSTVIEFIRLKKRGVGSNKFLKNVNKVYLFNVIAFSTLLLLTGNRGDLLCIVLPPIILFYLFIHKLSNKIIILFSVVGLALFVVLGHTRNSDLDSSDVVEELDLYGVFRDFGAAYINQKGLIQYADSKGFYGLSTGVNTAISSVPFLGGLILGDINETVESNTNNLTTYQWQVKGKEDSGLGSSLYGDLYYNGGLLLFIVYMFLLGSFLSNVYSKLYNGSFVSPVALIVFLWVFSNCIYLQRAPYFYLFRYIGYSLTIYFLYYLFAAFACKIIDKCDLS